MLFVILIELCVPETALPTSPPRPQVAETRDVMKRKALEIDKHRLDTRRLGVSSDRMPPSMGGERGLAAALLVV